MTYTPREGADLSGLVGVCSQGRPGLITHAKDLPWGRSWVGIGLDDGTAWASRKPQIYTREELVALAEVKVSGDPVLSKVQAP